MLFVSSTFKSAVLYLLVISTNGEELLDFRCHGDNVTNLQPLCLTQDYRKDVLLLTTSPINVTILSLIHI